MDWKKYSTVAEYALKLFCAQLSHLAYEWDEWNTLDCGYNGIHLNWNTFVSVFIFVLIYLEIAAMYKIHFSEFNMWLYLFVITSINCYLLSSCQRLLRQTLPFYYTIIIGDHVFASLLITVRKIIHLDCFSDIPRGHWNLEQITTRLKI